jgi:hypothetical protein
MDGKACVWLVMDGETGWDRPLRLCLVLGFVWVSADNVGLRTSCPKHLLCIHIHDLMISVS